MTVNVKMLAAINADVKRLVGLKSLKQAEAGRLFNELRTLATAGPAFSAFAEKPTSVAYRARVQQLEQSGFAAVNAATKAYVDRRNKQIRGERVATFAEAPQRGKQGQFAELAARTQEYVNRRNKEIAGKR